jgi:BirA family biotin operon repressor/biotin-[acetyl-CoA-carboxylase] ligase
MTDILDEDVLARTIKTRWLGQRLHYLPRATSTNTVLATLAAEDAPAGTLVVTDYQEQGRGRRQRRWVAPPRTSLLFSLLFRPNWPAAQASSLIMMSGLAAIAAIEHTTDLRAALKWPNDVMLAISGSWRKTGGILLETEMERDRLQQAIVGVGLNVNMKADQLPDAPTPATSLLVAGGHTVSRAMLLARFLETLEEAYAAAAAGTSPYQAWNERLILRGKMVTIRDEAHTLRGKVVGTDEWGRLLLRVADGTVRPIAAGDVTLRSDSDDKARDE